MAYSDKDNAGVGFLTYTPTVNETDQYYYHPDHLGSSSLITNLGGDLVQHIEYVPFGEVFVEERTSTWGTPYKFNAKELDEETGLYYYGARYLDPRTSVWLSVDPLAEKYPGVGSYVYCLNNPVKYVDPDGKFPWITGLIGGGVNLAIGYISAQVKHEDYSFGNGLRDFGIGFAVGSGAAYLAPALGLTSASTLGTKIVGGALIGSGTGLTSNLLQQTVDIANNDQENFNTDMFLFSGLVGVFSGSLGAGISAASQKFMNKVGEKLFKNFTKYELKEYINIQTKFLKRTLEATTGAKVGKNQLQKELNKAVKNWSDFKASEIQFLNVTTSEAAGKSGEIIVSIGAAKLVSNIEETNLNK